MVPAPLVFEPVNVRQAAGCDASSKGASSFYSHTLGRSPFASNRWYPLNCNAMVCSHCLCVICDVCAVFPEIHGVFISVPIEVFTRHDRINKIKTRRGTGPTGGPGRTRKYRHIVRIILQFTQGGREGMNIWICTHSQLPIPHDSNMIPHTMISN